MSPTPTGTPGASDVIPITGTNTGSGLGGVAVGGAVVVLLVAGAVGGSVLLRRRRARLREADPFEFLR